MPKKQIGKKIDVNGNQEDLGYTLNDEEVAKIKEIDLKVDKNDDETITGKKKFQTNEEYGFVPNASLIINNNYNGSNRELGLTSKDNMELVITSSFPDDLDHQYMGEISLNAKHLLFADLDSNGNPTKAEGIEFTNGELYKTVATLDSYEQSKIITEVDIANGTKAGVVKVGGGDYGIAMRSDGIVQTQYATEKDITDKTKYRYAITPINLDYAVKVGVTTNTKTLTEEEKAKAQEWLGVDNKLDKATDETSYAQVYVKNKDGTQEMVNLQTEGSNYVARGIPRFSSGGCISVGKPTYSSAATPKSYVDDKFNGANKAVSFNDYSAMITAINGYDKTTYSVGQNIMIVTLSVPDLWVSEIEEESATYTYSNDEAFINSLTTNGYVKVGYYKLSALETQKVDMEEYVKDTELADYVKSGELVDYVKNTDYASGSKAGVGKIDTTYGTRMYGTNSDIIGVVRATNDNITEKIHQYRAIVPANLDFAVKAGMSDSKIEWNDTEKGNARTLIDAQKTLTTDQLNAVNSGITSTLKGKITTNESNITNLQTNKEDKANLKALAYKDSLSKGDVGLGNVDNTSDANKPISNATQTALNNKADKSSLNNYLPKSGGTLNTGATIKLDTYGNRFLTISGNSIEADMSKETGGWAGNFSSVKDPAGDTTALLGWYGNGAGLEHIYMGGAYNDPYMKMTKSGNFTFKNKVNASISGNADTATKATQDGSGNNIVNTYATKNALSTVERKIPTNASDVGAISNDTPVITYGDSTSPAKGDTASVQMNLLNSSGDITGVFSIDTSNEMFGTAVSVADIGSGGSTINVMDSLSGDIVSLSSSGNINRINFNTGDTSVISLPTESGTIATTNDIPDSISDLTQDSTHRTVTDSQISSWDSKATTSYVDTKVANLVNSAPSTLDTLGEVATAIQNNATVVEALNSAIGNKADKTSLDTTNTKVSTNETNIAKKLDKVTYEYNRELAIGSTGKVLVGKFPMYDSNVTINVSSTTNTTYNGTLVIASQNINDSHGGTYVANVYGDPTGTLSSAFVVKYPTNSRVFEVYCNFPSWSKNLIHIKAVALSSAPSNIVELVTTIPTDSLVTVNNVLKNTFLTGITSAQVTSALGYTPYNSTNPNGYVTSSGSVASATNATKLNNQDASYYLNYNNFTNRPTIPDTSNLVTINTQQKITGAKSFTGTVGNTQTEAGIYLGLDTNTGAENANMAIVSANTASYIDMGRPNIDYDFRIIKWNGTNSNNAQLVYGGNAYGTINIPQKDGTMALTSDLGTQATFSLSGTTLTITPK